MSLHSSQARFEHIQNLAAQRDLRTRVTKIAHTFLLADKRRLAQTKYSDKMRKLRLRKNPAQCRELHQSWAILYCGVGVASALHAVMDARKSVQTRALQSLTWLFQVSKCIGRLRLRLKKIREAHTLRVSAT